MRGVIFDFDGVIASSEALANIVPAETITPPGLPTTLEDSVTRYIGKRARETIAAIETGVGPPVPNGFSNDPKTATAERFRIDLREVDGATTFVARFACVPRCIASSSSTDRLLMCLDVLGLAEAFAGNVFSADMVARGMPAPDIFLLAAKRIGVPPLECMVIEDSVSGVQAGVAAGMRVIRLCAGAHVRDGHAERLLKAGAAYAAATRDEVSTIATPLFRGVE